MILARFIPIEYLGKNISTQKKTPRVHCDMRKTEFHPFFPRDFAFFQHTSIPNPSGYRLQDNRERLTSLRDRWNVLTAVSGEQSRH